MPDINPFIDVIARKFYLAQACYTLYGKNNLKYQDMGKLGMSFVKNIDDYLVDQLNYNYYLLQSNSDGMSMRDVQIGVQLLAGITDFAKASHQTELYNKLTAQDKDYQAKFAAILSRQQ